jgi:hypothetical protein
MSLLTLTTAGFFAEQSRVWLDEVVLRTCGATPSRSGCVPFFYAAALQRGKAFSLETPHESDLQPLSAGTDVLLRGFPPVLWQRLSLQDHRVCAPHDEIMNQLRSSMSLLDAMPDARALVSRFVRLLVLVDKSAQRVEPALGSLTSCSLPALPYCSFFSKKALLHLPPKELAPRPHHAWLAENIFHEALHNALTIDVLAGRIFPRDFRVADHPQVEIPWRIDDPALRNRAWPVDRVLHALVVYTGLHGLRELMLERPMEETERQFLRRSLPSARFAMQHLSSALRTSSGCFTEPAQHAVSVLCQYVDSLEPLDGGAIA